MIVLEFRLKRICQVFVVKGCVGAGLPLKKLENTISIKRVAQKVHPVLVGFGGPKPLGPRVVATPIFSSKGDPKMKT